MQACHKIKISFLKATVEGPSLLEPTWWLFPPKPWPAPEVGSPISHLSRSISSELSPCSSFFFFWQSEAFSFSPLWRSLRTSCSPVRISSVYPVICPVSTACGAQAWWPRYSSKNAQVQDKDYSLWQTWVLSHLSGRVLYLRFLCHLSVLHVQGAFLSGVPTESCVIGLGFVGCSAV